MVKLVVAGLLISQMASAQILGINQSPYNGVPKQLNEVLEGAQLCRAYENIQMHLRVGDFFNLVQKGASDVSPAPGITKNLISLAEYMQQYKDAQLSVKVITRRFASKVLQEPRLAEQLMPNKIMNQIIQNENGITSAQNLQSQFINEFESHIQLGGVSNKIVMAFAKNNGFLKTTDDLEKRQIILKSFAEGYVFTLLNVEFILSKRRQEYLNVSNQGTLRRIMHISSVVTDLISSHLTQNPNTVDILSISLTDDYKAICQFMDSNKQKYGHIRQQITDLNRAIRMGEIITQREYNALEGTMDANGRPIDLDPRFRQSGFR